MAAVSGGGEDGGSGGDCHRAADLRAHRVDDAPGRGIGHGRLLLKGRENDSGFYPGRRGSPFTYTFPATLYVNVGWGLPHHADTAVETNAALLPPPPRAIREQMPKFAPLCPLPLWGRVGVGLSITAADVVLVR